MVEVTEANSAVWRNVDLRMVAGVLHRSAAVEAHIRPELGLEALVECVSVACSCGEIPVRRVIITARIHGCEVREELFVRV